MNIQKERHSAPRVSDNQTAASMMTPDVEDVLEIWKHRPDALIEILHAVQIRYGWLDRPLLGRLADELKLPPSLVYGVASFYHAFRLEPRGQQTCTVCTGTSCHLQGGSRLLHELEKHFKIHSGTTTADGTLALKKIRCLGACGMAPLVRIEGNNGRASFHADMHPEQIIKLLQDVMQGAPPAGTTLLPVDIYGAVHSRIVLENCSNQDPEELSRARAAGAYATLARAVQEMTPEDVCRQITASGLRGRGGAGYPTGTKWQMVREGRGKHKYVVANGDEGDPGAFMDRTLMECDPHRVLEGMAIAGYAVGAASGFVYVRSEYPLAAQRLREAIAQAETAGVLGRHLSGTGFSFNVRVRIGAGAFVCGEETALMASIMGRRGQPVIRPPYPPQKGLWGHATLINNVETFANIVAIIGRGSEQFRSLGTAGNSGTKVFSISGDVARVGVVEVPLGTTMRELLTLAGGVTGGGFKAAQTGGASGGCIPASHIDLPIDYESLRGIGTIMGSGGLVVLNDQRCMVDVARFFMQFCCDESCGKCTPCRAGTQQALRILDRICAGRGIETELLQLEELCHLMQETSLCGLGMAAPTPVLSTLRWYRTEYLAHIRAGSCPTGVCNQGGES
ncbi:MAG: NAD(P)H-dependent oxidoreductase subunit E [Geobacteraceae bacterium]|nr:NAD(P)H-dependent oxidoreductase subunit E [Geobacteraceae bacterium]